MTVDLPAIATGADADLQKAIDALTARRGDPGADQKAINARVEGLEAKQTALADLTLAAIEESPQNRAAVAALTGAAAKLTARAAEMTKVAAVLDKASEVSDAATSVITALGGLAAKA